jgi:predicted AlkP superfamily phosphohydrolase/phosphomutase
MVEKKVCIIGLDCLEYTVVCRGKYPNLKQKHHGRVQLNVYPPNTEMIWASFITGEKPEKHGIIADMEMNRGITELVKKVSVRVGVQKVLPKIRSKVTKAFNVTKTFNLLPRTHVKEDFQVPTIFDYADKSISVSIPAYNEWSECVKSRKMIVDAIGNPYKEKSLAEKAWTDFQQKKKRVMKLLNDDWDLFMVHFYVADIIQHLWWYKKDLMANLYQKMDETAKQIEMKLPPEVFTLILSDHGFMNGYHSPYAFYSSNKPINLKRPKITDFAHIIREKLGIPSKHEIKEIKERLRSLGYA